MCGQGLELKDSYDRQAVAVVQFDSWQYSWADEVQRRMVHYREARLGRRGCYRGGGTRIRMGLGLGLWELLRYLRWRGRSRGRSRRPREVRRAGGDAGGGFPFT